LTRRAKGPIYLALTTSADKVIAALQKAQARIRKWDAAEVLSDAQIRNAKVRLRVEDIYAREKTSSFCHLLGRWWAAAGLPYYLSYVSKLQAVTRADMQRFVRTYIQGKPKVVGVLVSKQDGAQAGLSKAALEKALATVGGNQTPKSKNPKTEEGAGDES
jgi:zinc protease